MDKEMASIVLQAEAMAKERRSPSIGPVHLLLALTLNAEDSTLHFLEEFGLTTERLFKFSLPVEPVPGDELPKTMELSAAARNVVLAYVTFTSAADLHWPQSQYLLTVLLDDAEIQECLTRLNIDVKAMAQALKARNQLEKPQEKSTSEMSKEDILGKIQLWYHRAEMAYANGRLQLGHEALKEAEYFEALLLEKQQVNGDGHGDGDEAEAGAGAGAGAEAGAGAGAGAGAEAGAGAGAGAEAGAGAGAGAEADGDWARDEAEAKQNFSEQKLEEEEEDQQQQQKLNNELFPADLP